MKRKSLLLIAFALVFATVLNLFAGVIGFAEDAGDATTVTEITTADELKAIADNLSGNYKLMNNIDLADPKGNKTAWIPLGTFTGTFDGNGYTISGFTIEGATTAGVGFFSQVNGTVQNLVIANATIYTSETATGVGAIAGRLDTTNGKIINCKTNPDVLVTTYANGVHGGRDLDIGGMVGWAGGGNYSVLISHCENNASVIVTQNTNSTNEVSSSYVGGIVGNINHGVVEYCVNNGSVTIAETITVDDGSVHDCGGIVGSMGMWKNGVTTITNCINTGSVNGKALDNNASAGGIVGIAPDRSNVKRTFTHNYNFGTISGNGAKDATNNDEYIGQLIGYIELSPAVLSGNYGVSEKGSAYGSISVPQLEGMDVSNSESELKAQKEYQSIRTEEISTADELRIAVRMNFSRDYKLLNNISLADLEGNQTAWTPFGDFEGTFDGNGHTISGFTVSGTTTKQAGLFTKLTGTIKNLTLANATIYTSASTHYVGALVGESNGRVENCVIADTVTVTNYTDGKHADQLALGGIVGYGGVGSVTADCVSYATVTVNKNVKSNESTLEGFVGGIVGRLAVGTIEYCINNGAVTINDYEHKKGAGMTGVGGITGGLTPWNGVTATVQYCINNGTVTGNASEYSTTAASHDSCGGGIAGSTAGGNTNASSRVIQHCYNFGQVISGTKNGDYVAAIIGGLGIVGANRVPVTCQDNYSIDTAGKKVVGNLIEAQSCSVTNCVLKSITDIVNDEAYLALADALNEKGIFATTMATDYYGYQTNTPADSKFDLRLIATVSGDYKKMANVGFKVSATYVDNAGVTRTKNPDSDFVINTLYTSITSVENGVENDVTTYSAEDLGGDYIFVLVCKGLPADAQSITITVTTFYTDLDHSVVVTGETFTVSVDMSEVTPVA